MQRELDLPLKISESFQVSAVFASPFSVLSLTFTLPSDAFYRPF